LWSAGRAAVKPVAPGAGIRYPAGERTRNFAMRLGYVILYVPDVAATAAF
jgi:hypothetical protein